MVFFHLPSTLGPFIPLLTKLSQLQQNLVWQRLSVTKQHVNWKGNTIKCKLNWVFKIVLKWYNSALDASLTLAVLPLETQHANNYPSTRGNTLFSKNYGGRVIMCNALAAHGCGIMYLTCHLAFSLFACGRLLLCVRWWRGRSYGDDGGVRWWDWCAWCCFVTSECYSSPL